MRVAIKRGTGKGTPLLICNGLGANLEVIQPLAQALSGVETILFDVPGIGGSSLPRHPYRFRALARMVDKLSRALSYKGPIDVMGVSWGGALAQEIARHWGPTRCRRLVLAATCAGGFVIPGSWSAMAKLLSPQRYADRDYLRRIGPKIYGGKIADDPALLDRFAAHIEFPDPYGYFCQQLAMLGWFSVRWLPQLRQPTLVLAGTRDPLIHVANARLLVRRIPNARLQLVDDGHLFVLTTGSVATSIVKFLRDSNER
jgi:poly(3-hydroxyalkanoate) depolymerase